ncbi:uncharacterized protein EV422DRAFT_540565 [Fimicolochytrium jonesii]|uniref:uncharacterized protein n=1 Tax=Fimicolochytrium jonesii TaxID=1396493 RepID=UPI0022FED8A5|nr:uncharacterized protein EV422DRAFT_540565 [Fimicolochytrium jonesii]KAI8817709.1 hypothetical protein EV422DRAFT_540565 [Fimicolochytrium jonesii]
MTLITSPSSPSTPPTRRPFFPPLTTRQTLYVLLMHSIGSGFLDAGINFAIAYAMYKNSPSFLWNFPNTLAGDAAVTVLVQGTLTWVLDGALTWKDVRAGTVRPIVEAGVEGWRLPQSGLGAWLTRPSLDLFGPGISGRARVQRIVNAFIRGFVFSLLCLPLAWGLGIGLGCAFWPAMRHNEDVMGWGPLIWKAVYTFFLGALTTPVTTLIAMAQATPRLDDAGFKMDEAGEGVRGARADDKA